jgi:hypothetical protein
MQNHDYSAGHVGQASVQFHSVFLKLGIKKMQAQCPRHE